MKRRSSERIFKPEDFVDRDPDKFVVKFVNSRVGYGLFATENFRTGDFLLFYRGRKLAAKDVKEFNEFLFYIPSEDCYIDGADTELGGVGKFVNDEHRRPNARAVLYRVGGENLIALKSKTLIEKGDEIRYDYLFGNKNGTCPWRDDTFTSRSIQCQMDETEERCPLELSSESFPVDDNLKESFCQVEEGGNLEAESYLVRG